MGHPIIITPVTLAGNVVTQTWIIEVENHSVYHLVNIHSYSFLGDEMTNTTMEYDLCLADVNVSTGTWIRQVENYNDRHTIFHIPPFMNVMYFVHTSMNKNVYHKLHFELYISTHDCIL